MQAQCPKCEKKHNLYYLIKANNTRALFMLCAKMKGQEQGYTLFLPLRDGLDIPTYLSTSDAYTALKDSAQTDGEYSDADRKVLSQWRSARLALKDMSQEEKELVKRYVRGNIRW